MRQTVRLESSCFTAMILLFDCGDQFFARGWRLEGGSSSEEAVLHEELIGGDKRDGAPRLFVKEAVCLARCDLEVDGFRAEGLPFGVGLVPAFFPAVMIAEESNGRREV